MIIKNESGITGAVVKKLRLNAKLSQKAFWGAFGKTQSNGHFYEEKGRPIPKAYRTLIFAVHVVGLKLDLTTPEGVERAKFLANAQKIYDAELEVAKRERAAVDAKIDLDKVRNAA